MFTVIGDTLGGLPYFLFSCCSIGTSLGLTLGGIPGFLRSDVSIVASLGATLVGIPFFLVYVCTRGYGACCWCCLVDYLCVTWSQPCSSYFSTSHHRPLCLLIDFWYATLGMMLNISSSFISAVWYVSLIVAKWCFNVSTKYISASVAALADDTLGILTFWGGNYTNPEILSDIVFVTNTF